MKREVESRRSGLSAIETLVSITILAGFLSAFTAAISSSRGEVALSMTETELRGRAQHALLRIDRVLERTQMGATFPAVFDDATIGDTYDHLRHAGASAGTEVREVAFPEPLDADGDGWPDVGAGRDLDWAAAPSALVVEADMNGDNALVHIDGRSGVRRTIVRGVQAFVVDTAATGGFAFPLDVLRVRLDLVRDPSNPGLAPVSFTSFVNLPRNEDLP